MKITDLINSDSLPGFVKWYIETICPAEDERLAYCRKSYGSVTKKMAKEIEAAGRLKGKKVSKKNL